MSKEFENPAMNKAMEEALAAVERREKDPSDDDEPEVEVITETEEPTGDTGEPAAAASDGDDDDEVAAVKDQLLRLAADFENFRKRSTREMRDARKYGGESVLHGLLPVLDNLERAVTHSGEEEDSPIVQGLRMVVKQFHDAFASFGVVGFDSLGQPFDPERHDAVGQTAATDAAPGTIVEEMLKGYFFHERLLRPARVVVAAAPAEEVAEEGEESVSNGEETGDE